MRETLKTYLNNICSSLPGENDSSRNPEGVEFAAIMLNSDDYHGEIVEGNDLHEKAVNKLIMKIMEERDDLVDYKHLRQKLVAEINNGR